MEQGRNKKCKDKVEVIVYERVNHGKNEERISIEANGYVQQSLQAMSFATGQPAQCIGHESMLVMVDWKAKNLIVLPIPIRRMVRTKYKF